MSNDGFNVYKYWLEKQRVSRGDLDKKLAVETLCSTIKDSASYDATILKNGQPQPMAVIRKSANECEFTVMPNDELYIGDLLTVFKEDWLCTEVYEDEYGITYAKALMCNHEFVYQDFNGKIIKKRGVIESGSYSKDNDKSIPIVNGNYVCYMSLDEESASLFIDKRLAIDTLLDKDGTEILEVCKIKWIDTKSKNHGEHSHLMLFAITEDVYDAENDNVKLMICDYKNFDVGETETPSSPSESGYLVISGKDSIRIGTGRTYKVTAVGARGDTETAKNVVWSINDEEGIACKPDGDRCVLRVALSDALIGKQAVLSCKDQSEKYKTAVKIVEVISIG